MITNQTHAFNHRNLFNENVLSFNHALKKSTAVIQNQSVDFSKKNQMPAVDGQYEPLKIRHETALEYFSFIDDIPSLTDEEKHMIYGAIGESVTHSVNGIADGTSLSMAQTVFELSFLNDHFIPEEYQEQMNEAIQTYRQDQSRAYGDTLRQVYEGFHKTMSNLADMGDRANQMGGILDEVKKGEHHLQTTEALYHQWFEGIKGTDSFIHGFEDVLNKFEQQLIKQYGNQSNHTKENAEHVKEQIRDNWNDFIRHLPMVDSYKLPTKKASVIDISI